ncbi:GGDEF domain-containing protein [Actinoplanes couchii]|uniref:GGDEF domain-containing protein n=1 Tax=Actinoplanes couchii TaxID=403638 RepID=UPI0019453ECE|nr:diguanylate cyclase [Actinoplanes couchii]MDR6321619.1 GGDEF domain-containing protein [Actinoplanes couchii]
MTPLARAAIVAQLEELELLIARDFQTVSAPAAVLELQAREHGWADLVWRTQLIIADVAGRRGDIAEQGRVARRANMWAEEHGDDVLLARSHRQLAVVFRRLGDYAQALVHAVAGLQHAGPLPARLRCSQLITLAIALDLNGRFDDARRRFTEAMRIADDNDDAHQALTILNNMAFTAYENEEVDEANTLARQMRTLSGTSGIPLDGLYLDTLARILMMQRRWAEAEAILRPILDDPSGPLLSEGDSLPECLLTLTEIYAAQGRHALVGETLDTAGRLCAERGLGSHAARVHRARAEWYATAGDYREAYQEYQIYHERTEALHSAEREARAYAMQALFEATEARQASDRFQEMAERDALTGLFNRRYLDEKLAATLAAARRTGESTALAIIDLDHFKRINDTLSHAAGDEVLREIGVLLRSFAATSPAAAPSTAASLSAAAFDAASSAADSLDTAAFDAASFATVAFDTAAFAAAAEIPARLGGEEFVLLLPGADAAAAHARGEQLAELIRSRDWSPVTGGLPVTASIGIAACEAGELSPSVLLGQADEWLYKAKRNGRDQVRSVLHSSCAT